jgi:endogenous inhibitor of DNA gyrase (YacG/DUF329 family)
MTDAPPPPATPKPPRPCPICGRMSVAAFHPFCSKRCADIDLGRWLKEGYRVPTDEAPGEEDLDERGGGESGQRS